MLAMAGHPRVHPSVRINAALMIGELNSEPKGTKPMPETADVLLKIVTNPDQLDAVKVAAMEGLLRHARGRFEDDPTMQGKVTVVMLPLVKPATVKIADPAAQTWMRVKAADILGTMGLPGTDGNVADAICMIVVDPKVPMSLRTTAARALGKLDSKKGKVNSAHVAAALGRLASDAMSVEIRDQQGIYDRRVKTHLDGCLYGFKALGAAASIQPALAVRAPIDSAQKHVAAKPGDGAEAQLKEFHDSLEEALKAVPK
jgi:hypothetical protein